MKINKIIAGIMAVCLMGTVIPYVNTVAENNSVITASADDETDYTEGTYENLAYKNYSDYIEISGCDVSATDVVIPPEIDGVPVTSIGEYAFYDCKSLISITIPDRITNIGGSAFFCTPWLEEKQKENSLVIVNDILIDGSTCSGDIIIPDSVTSISNFAFGGCTELTSVIISDSVTSIGSNAFYYCKSLTSIIIPDSVTSIGNFAFGACTNLTSITIPDSVTSIGEYALYDTPWFKGKQQENPLVIVNDILIDGSTCSGNIIIPDIIKSISNFAFGSCTELTSIIIPDSVESIGIGVFSECTGLTSVIIPDSVAIIDEMAFSECTSLTSITIPDSVTTIGCTAFYGCKSLESVTIPNNVISIVTGAFCNCENLTSITILNPDCEIADDESTISNGWDKKNNNYFNGTIYGYENSTAQAYAESNFCKFESLGKAPEKVMGDINDDGEFNVADVVLLNKYLLGISDTALSNLKNADLCADGRLDVFDLCMMKKKLVEDLI